MANIVQHEHKSRGARAATAGVSDQPEFKSNLVKFLPAATGEGTPTYFETVIRVASGKAARNANLVFVVDISGSMAGKLRCCGSTSMKTLDWTSAVLILQVPLRRTCARYCARSMA